MWFMGLWLKPHVELKLDWQGRLISFSKSLFTQGNRVDLQVTKLAVKCWLGSISVKETSHTLSSEQMDSNWEGQIIRVTAIALNHLFLTQIQILLTTCLKILMNRAILKTLIYCLENLLFMAARFLWIKQAYRIFA